MPEYKTPGVFVEEIPSFPPSISGVETSIPAFIGATQKADKITPGDLDLVPTTIDSMPEYEQYYGLAAPETGINVTIDTTSPPSAKASILNRAPYCMYHALRHFFANGGGKCYIISIGDYSKSVKTTDLLKGLEKAAETREITMLLFPDATRLPTATTYYSICKEALKQCAEKKDRIAPY